MSSDLKRPREDGGVWGSYVTYLADLETSVSGLRQELDEARAERDRLRTLTSQVDYALRLLVNLKDGPRDEAYARDKPTAWQLAREAVAAVDAYRSSTPDAEPAPGVPVDTEATP